MTNVHEGADGELHVYLDVTRPSGLHEEVLFDEEPTPCPQ